MEKGKYFRLSHFVPDGHPQVHPGTSSEVKEMMPYLVERTSRGWTAVPGHEDLELFATRKIDVPILGFRKNKKEVYVHVFCNEFIDPIHVVHIVLTLYNKYKLGTPAFLPEERNWIHTIPIPGANLNPVETLLIHQLTQSLFWTIYMDYKRNKGQ